MFCIIAQGGHLLQHLVLALEIVIEGIARAARFQSYYPRTDKRSEETLPVSSLLKFCDVLRVLARAPAHGVHRKSVLAYRPIPATANAL